MDWKDVVGAVAPGLATMLGGPLAGGVVKVLADKVLGGSTGDPVQDEAKLAGVLAGGASPELQAKIVEAANIVKLEMIKAGVREKEIAADLDKAAMADTAHARDAHAKNESVLRLGYLINIASYLLIGLVLFGCFSLASRSGKLDIDPGIAATVGAIVGAVVQWVMANAQQANGFFFGSSPGSRELARDLGKAVANAGAVAKPK